MRSPSRACQITEASGSRRHEGGVEPGGAAQHGVFAGDHAAAGHAAGLHEAGGEVAGADVFGQGGCHGALDFNAKLFCKFHRESPKMYRPEF
jgi:hypothetical protein